MDTGTLARRERIGNFDWCRLLGRLASPAQPLDTPFDRLMHAKGFKSHDEVLGFFLEQAQRVPRLCNRGGTIDLTITATARLAAEFSAALAVSPPSTPAAKE